MRALAAIVLFVLMSLAALAQDVTSLVNALAPGSFKEREAAVAALVASGDAAAVPVLEALAAGNLHVRKADQKVFITAAKGDVLLLMDPQGFEPRRRSAKSRT